MDQHRMFMTSDTGEQYFIYGNNRIKFTEYFPDDGKTLDELFQEYIESEVRKRIRKTA